MVCLPPPSRLLSAFTTDPPERGLMRANDGNACCCFPFINGSTLAYRTQLFIISSLRSARRVFPLPSFTSPLRLSPSTSFITQMEWIFFVFLNLHSSSLSALFILPPPPPLWILTCVNVLLITAQCHFSGQTETLWVKQMHLPRQSVDFSLWKPKSHCQFSLS